MSSVFLIHRPITNLTNVECIELYAEYKHFHTSKDVTVLYTITDKLQSEILQLWTFGIAPIKIYMRVQFTQYNKLIRKKWI